MCSFFLGTDFQLATIEYLAKLEDYRIKDGNTDFHTTLALIHNWLRRESGLRPESIRDIAFKLLQSEEQTYPIGALALLAASLDLALQGSLCHEVLQFVDGIVHDIRKVIRNLPPSCGSFGRRKARECGFDTLKRTSDMLGHRTSDREALRSQANILSSLSHIRADEGSADGAIAYGKQSIDLLNRYSDRPAGYRIYGFSLYNVAWAYYIKGDHGESMNYYSEALKAFAKAIDMHEDEKREWIRQTRRQLDIARNDSK